jgi:hypothetical protein
VQELAWIAGISFAAGLNLYATVTILGLLHRLQVIQLPGDLGILSHPLVLGVAALMYVIEFVADKVPYVDNAWDVLHTFIRPPAAALLAFGALVSVPEAWRWAAALAAGGIALTSHGAKASARAAVNVSPEPVSNSLLSLAEDAVAAGLTWIAVHHPVVTFVVVLLLTILSVYVMVKFLRQVVLLGRRLFSGSRT